MFENTNNIIQSENINNMVYDGIGFDGIRYIQQTGDKIAGKIYLDKTQPGLWYCLKTTSAINNTSDFTRADSTALLDKLQNLVTFHRLSDNRGFCKKYADGSMEMFIVVIEAGGSGEPSTSFEIPFNKVYGAVISLSNAKDPGEESVWGRYPRILELTTTTIKLKRAHGFSSTMYVSVYGTWK